MRFRRKHPREMQRQSRKCCENIHVYINNSFQFSMRHKFMLETLSNIKNNKIRNGPTSSGAADKELVLKLKKFLNGLSKKRATRSTEALRVSLDDIHNIDTKGNTKLENDDICYILMSLTGKWWLVGASWKDNMVGSESKNQRKQVKMAIDLRKDQSLHDALLKLARKQGMNTDVRRSIFVTIMSAEVIDMTIYVDPSYSTFSIN